MADQTSNYGLHVVVPMWLPFNDSAIELVDQLLGVFGYPTTGPKAEKYRIAVASLLKASRAVRIRSNATAPQYLGVRLRAGAWSLYPMIGRVIWKTVTEDFVRYYHAERVEGSGDSGLFQDEQGKWRTDPVMTMYALDGDAFPDELIDACFVDVGRPLVKVNAAETRKQKKRREGERKAKPHLRRAEARAVNKDLLRASESRVERLNQFWRMHLSSPT